MCGPPLQSLSMYSVGKIALSKEEVRFGPQSADQQTP